MTNTLLGQVKKSVENNRVQDQTEDKGGFERKIIPEHPGYPARFVGYIEVGDRDGGEYQGKKKADTRKAYAFFQLLSKSLGEEIEVDGEKKTIYPIHREMLDVKQGEKANLTKLFNRMANGRQLTHIAEMLGEPFRVGIKHKVVGEGKDQRTYENARTPDDGWLIRAPLMEVEDPETGELVVKTMKVPEAREPLKLLLWDDPTPEQWDSIKGREYKYKEGKGESAVEKTFAGGYYQYMCVTQALDFAGSPLEAMLAGGSLPDMSVVDDLDGDGIPEDLGGDLDDTPETPDEPIGDAGAEDLGTDDFEDLPE